MTSPESAGGLRFFLSRRFGFVLGLSFVACNEPTGLERNDQALAVCAEYAGISEADIKPEETMLPGSACGTCHQAGGQARNSPFTVSGTVYSSATSPCNAVGRAGIHVQVLYGQDDPLGCPTTGCIYHKDDPQPGGLLVTNSVGNFYSSNRFVEPMAVRIFDPKNSTAGMRMNLLLGQTQPGMSKTTNCNSCHSPGNPALGGSSSDGRIYLP